MGWVVAVVLTLMVGALLAIRVGTVAAAVATAAVMLTALAGYAWQGNPRLSAARAMRSAAESAPDSLFAAERDQWIPAYGHDADRLAYLDALERNGLLSEASGEAERFLAQSPRSMPLALGRANALFLRSRDIVSPPVVLAFEAAARLAPRDPAPPYFFGLALAQSGAFDEASMVWRATIERTPPGAAWRGRIEQRLQRLDALRARIAKVSAE